MRIQTNQKILTSVGIDIGSSTSHLVFSHLTLEKDITSRTEKFEVTKKEVIYSGPIHMTPFSSPDNIDMNALTEMLLNDYRDAGIERDEIDTGAIIITGESAKKENASRIVEMLADETGKFVSATAGPNFESVLSAYGSGAVSRSKKNCLTIMNVDVGGGSSNIAICKDGRVIATSAINVGGRLLAFDSDRRIIRLERSCAKLADKIGLPLQLGSIISDDEIEVLVEQLADSLYEAILSKNSEITNFIMMTDHHGFTEAIDEITFSGGVAEFIYNRESRDFGDLGPFLANAITSRIKKNGFQITDPRHRIRATVIGAGQSSLKVSGSTTFLSAELKYPLRNIPVINPFLDHKLDLTSENVKQAIIQSIKQMDLEEGKDQFILAVNASVRPSYEKLTEFAKGVVQALPKVVKNKQPILLCFSDDIGNSVGNVLKRETAIQNPLLSIDELSLKEGDFVDIGEPIIENVVVPVIVKTLVFSEDGVL